MNDQVFSRFHYKRHGSAVAGCKGFPKEIDGSPYFAAGLASPPIRLRSRMSLSGIGFAYVRRRHQGCFGSGMEPTLFF
ncbi:MAG: hypothetical protein ABSH22_03770 [Tepidisphaeraceae bacterium]